MPQYQLPVAIALGVTLGGSLAEYALHRSSERTNALPTFLEGEEGLARDPFDVTKPEDLIDGIPLDEEGFWRKVRRTHNSVFQATFIEYSCTHQIWLRKLTMAVVFTVILVIQSISLGWSITEDDRPSITVYSLHVAFALYALVISTLTLNQTYSKHSRSIIHFFVLSLAATACLGTTAILPSEPFPGPVVSVHERSGAPLVLWYTVLALYAVNLFISVTTPRGPRLHLPSEQIYSDKTLMQVTSKYDDNVCGITGVL